MKSDEKQPKAKIKPQIGKPSLSIGISFVVVVVVVGVADLEKAISLDAEVCELESWRSVKKCS